MPDYRPIGSALGGAMPDWPFAPMMAGDWRELKPELVAAFQSQSARDEHRGAAPLPSPVLRIRVLKLSFYPGWLLAEALSAYGENQTGVFAMLIGPEGYTLLRGESATIHSLNLRVLSLGGRGSRINEYLRFFTSALRAENGSFRIFEEASEIEREFTVTKKAKTRINDLVKPIRRLRGASPGSLREACVLYGRDLFLSRFQVLSSGMVDMLEDRRICKNVISNPQIHQDIWRLPQWRQNGRRRERNEPHQ